MIGGEIYYIPRKGNIKISRLTKNNFDKQNTNIIVKCIGDNLKSKIGLSMVQDEDIYVDTAANSTARTYATLVIEPKIDLATQTGTMRRENLVKNMPLLKIAAIGLPLKYSYIPIQYIQDVLWNSQRTKQCNW